MRAKLCVYDVKDCAREYSDRCLMVIGFRAKTQSTPNAQRLTPNFRIPAVPAPAVRQIAAVRWPPPHRAVPLHPHSWRCRWWLTPAPAGLASVLAPASALSTPPVQLTNPPPVCCGHRPAGNAATPDIARLIAAPVRH